MAKLVGRTVFSVSFYWEPRSVEKALLLVDLFKCGYKTAAAASDFRVVCLQETFESGACSRPECSKDRANDCSIYLN